jgi:hypothetical protein
MANPFNFIKAWKTKHSGTVHETDYVTSTDNDDETKRGLDANIIQTNKNNQIATNDRESRDLLRTIAKELREVNFNLRAITGEDPMDTGEKNGDN